MTKPLLSIILPFSQSFASSDPRTSDMTIQLFMVTTDKPCTEIGLNIRTFYSELIKRYFENYGYSSVYIDNSCVTVEEINSDDFPQYDDQYDLIIFIPDKEDSKKYRGIVQEDGKKRFGHIRWTTNPPPNLFISCPNIWWITQIKKNEMR